MRQTGWHARNWVSWAGGRPALVAGELGSRWPAAGSSSYNSSSCSSLNPAPQPCSGEPGHAASSRRASRAGRAAGDAWHETVDAGAQRRARAPQGRAARLPPSAAAHRRRSPLLQATSRSPALGSVSQRHPQHPPGAHSGTHALAAAARCRSTPRAAHHSPTCTRSRQQQRHSGQPCRRQTRVRRPLRWPSRRWTTGSTCSMRACGGSLGRGFLAGWLAHPPLVCTGRPARQLCCPGLPPPACLPWLNTARARPAPRSLVGVCYEKCIDKRYKDGELSVGENSCIDRCSSKYWQVRARTGLSGCVAGGWVAPQAAGGGRERRGMRRRSRPMAGQQHHALEGAVPPAADTPPSRPPSLATTKVTGIVGQMLGAQGQQ